MGIKFTDTDKKATEVYKKVVNMPGYNVDNSRAQYKWYTGEELLKRLDNKAEQKYKKRYVYNDLMFFLRNYGNDMCALYGLRRTGKSVLMRQAIRELIEIDKINPKEIAYITFNKSTNYTDDTLVKEVRTLSKIVKYFFIDEVSYINMELENNALNLLADEFATSGIKFVFAGTFSYAIKLLTLDIWLGRLYLINTTYFSFKEAHNVFGYDIEYFIQNGGIINENTKMTPQEYMKTAVTDNIVESLLKSEKIYELAYINKDIKAALDNKKQLKQTLIVLIKRIIDSYMRILFYNKITKENYKFSDVGNLADLIRQRSERDNYEDTMLSIIQIPEKKYQEMLQNFIGKISNQDISEKFFNEILIILKQIGLIEDIYLNNAHESCFITNYLRYGLCEEILYELSDTVTTDTQGRYNISLASDNLKGGILEGIIDLDLQHTNRYNFDKYRNADNYEVDVIIKNSNRTMDLYEVKHSSLPLDTHAKNLLNRDFINEIEQVMGYKVVSYNVIYNGQKMTKQINPEQVFRAEKEYSIRQGGKKRWGNLEQRAKTFDWDDITVNFINATEFLCNI